MSSDGTVRTPTRPPIPMPAVPAVAASKTPAKATGRLSEASRVAAAMRVADQDSELALAHVGPSIHLRGDLAGDEDTLIEGRVEGRIELPGHHLTIGVHGTVVGHVVARQVTVLGRVEGDLAVSERIEVAAGGKVDGDIRAPTLVIREGAEFNGSVTMGEAAKTVAKRPTPTTRLGTNLMMLEPSPPSAPPAPTSSTAPAEDRGRKPDGADTPSPAVTAGDPGGVAQ
jgi:cytoskeletal protein CcmA (bactofilin family)